MLLRLLSNREREEEREYNAELYIHIYIYKQSPCRVILNYCLGRAFVADAECEKMVKYLAKEEGLMYREPVPPDNAL